MKINSKTVELLNAKHKDLALEVEIYFRIGNMSSDLLPSLEQFRSDLQSKIVDSLNPISTGEDDLDTNIKLALYASEHKMKVYVQMDRNISQLKEVGATPEQVQGTEDFKETLRKELFSVYNITEEDVKEDE